MIRAAVIGTGFGCVTHVRALRGAGIEVAAVVGRDLEKTKTRAALFDVPLAFSSVDEALGLEDLDAVTIATPPHTHAEIALKAIAAGKHLICEALRSRHRRGTHDAGRGRGGRHRAPARV